MTVSPSRALLAAVERQRRRLWLLCYRMTGSRADADDLSQEAIARAIEREAALAHDQRLDGWLIRVATTTCLDHLRHHRVERRAAELVDPLDDPALAPGGAPARDPEAATILRDDVRFAVVAALQWVPARQRAAVILHDVCDRPLDEIAALLGVNANAAKAVLARGRATLARARRRGDVDPTADPAVVARLLDAIRERSVASFAALLDEDVWGVVDGGGVIQAARKPTVGPRAVSRQWANANRRLPAELVGRAVRLNGEAAALVALPGSDLPPLALVHVETRAGRIAALRVLRDPRRLEWMGRAVGAAS